MVVSTTAHSSGLGWPITQELRIKIEMNINISFLMVCRFSL